MASVQRCHKMLYIFGLKNIKRDHDTQTKQRKTKTIECFVTLQIWSLTELLPYVRDGDGLNVKCSYYWMLLLEPRKRKQKMLFI